MTPAGRRVVGLLFALTCLVLLGAVAPPAAPPTLPPLHHPDEACRTCHQQIYDRYQRTPMAQGSGYAADGLDATERKAGAFNHEPSGVTYRITERAGQVTLSFHRSDAPQRAGVDGEQRLEYFIGSGRRGRTFLYRVGDQLWFEAPINWYAKKQLWDMAPAYGSFSFMPAPLPVDANCLHCHASEVQPSVGGARNRFAAAPFAAPGVGCASCHGDPASHLAAEAHGQLGTILNPNRLAPVQRDSVCLQCHLEGDAAVYLPNKSLAAFQPGQNLFDSALYFVDANRAQQGGRASSQYEALLRSACKRGAGDRLTCTTCHDPHDSPAPAERVAFFRAKCLACHTTPAMATHHPEQPDCATCHMPTRKTLDISHEQLTDHDIEARPATARPSARRSPELIPVGVAKASPREEGLAYAQLAQRGDRVSGEHALRLLQQAQANGADDIELHNQLGFLLQLAGSPAAAADQYLAALRQSPQDTTAAANLAVLDAGQGKVAAAVTLLRQVVATDPSQTAVGLNLAFLECRLGQKAEAQAIIRQMLLFHPDSDAARQMLATGDYGGQTCKLR
jgi:predicted CXXCH cytochrome family protein